ncbi:hypothetical protein Tco_1335373 [Tanacetum coccineum]
MNWGEVNPVHAYYNGSCTSKDNEDPSWSTSFKTRRTSKTSSALEALWKTLFMLYLYKIGTFLRKSKGLLGKKLQKKEAKDTALIEQIEDKGRSSLLHRELDKLETSHQPELNSGTKCKKRPRAKHDEESVKKHKLEDEAEREELRSRLDIVPRDDIAMDFESLAIKYLIIDWKIHILTEDMMYYQIVRADGSFKNYKIFSGMLDDFDIQDVIDLYRLVKERYETTIPEGYDLLLWGDLKTLFEPSKEDEIWKNQQDYNLISWRLFDSCGVHVLLMDTGIAIHMMVENTYPLTQEMLSRMLNRRLEVDHESEMAFELLSTDNEDPTEYKFKTRRTSRRHSSSWKRFGRQPTPKNLRKPQIQIDEELAQRKKRLRYALIEQIESQQDDADELLAERIQQEEREQFTINEQARMLVDLIAERKKKLYKKEQQWINDFVPMSDDSGKKDNSSSCNKSSKKNQEQNMMKRVSRSIN